jgi:predicted aspartyl protease
MAKGPFMRILIISAILAALPPVSPVWAADCGKLQILDIIHLTPAYGGLEERLPLTINGVQKSFIFDTGGFFTQVASSVAQDMKLPVRQGRIQMIDVTGRISRDEASIHELVIGHMRGTDVDIPVSPSPLPADGIFALDFLHTSDVDMDFASDTLRLFSQDHCDGQVVYWTSPASVAIVPVNMQGYHMVVPVMLDGHEERALIDTGATGSTMLIDEAHRVFDLTMGSDDTPEKGHLNGDDTLKTYSHEFKALAFGDVSVTNPRLTLIPNAVGRNMDKAQLVGDRTKTEKDLLNTQDMIIGMDVLRKLHIYIALAEHKMYISQASPPAPAGTQ